jgi:hypothetical protein
MVFNPEPRLHFVSLVNEICATRLRLHACYSRRVRDMGVLIYICNTLRVHHYSALRE